MVTRNALSAVVVFAMGVVGIDAGRTAVAQQTAAGAYAAPSYTYKSSTIFEGAARGMADIVRSAGAANLMHSEAARNYEDARTKSLDNRLRWTQTYFDQRQLNNQYRQEMQGQRPSTEQLFRIAKERAPQPLSPSELDPYSGEIRWPKILLAVDYADDRVTVEDLIQKRSIDAVGMTIDDQTALGTALNSLAERMRTNISAYDPKEYVAAKNFLQSLAATTGSGTVY
jgi:hypothetical protein